MARSSFSRANLSVSGGAVRVNAARVHHGVEGSGAWRLSTAS